MVKMNESYWTYRAPAAEDYADLPPGVFKGTRQQWESLSPGMRREIVREHARRKVD